MFTSARTGGYRIYELASEQILCQSHEAAIASQAAPRLSWSPDGRRAAGDGELWDVRSGWRLARLPRWPTDRVAGAPAWSPDSTRLAYLTSDGAVAIYHAGYQRIEALLVHLPGGRALAVNAQGHVRGQSLDGQALDGADLVYLTEANSAGPEMLTPSEFAAKYGWKNDPEQVRVE